MMTRNKTTFFALAALLICLSLPRHAAAAPKTAALDQIQGAVQVSVKEDVWEAATQSQPIPAGASIRCGKDGSAVLHWTDGYDVALKLFPLTTLRLATLETQKKKSRGEPQLDLAAGRIIASARKRSGKNLQFVVRTPSAVTGVRGTVFAVDVSEDKSTVVSTLEDKVFVAAQNVELIVEAGFQSLVLDGQPPAEPKHIPEKQLEQLNEDSKAVSEIPAPQPENATTTPNPTDAVDNILNQPELPPAIEEPHMQ